MSGTDCGVKSDSLMLQGLNADVYGFRFSLVLDFWHHLAVDIPRIPGRVKVTRLSPRLDPVPDCC